MAYCSLPFGFAKGAGGSAAGAGVGFLIMQLTNNYTPLGFAP